MDVDKMTAGQKKLNLKAAADRRAKLVSDAKAGKMLPNSVPSSVKKKDTRSWSEKFDSITRGPNAGPKKSTGPGLVERVQNKLDGVARGKNAPPKSKTASTTTKRTPVKMSAAAERRSSTESRMRSRGQRVQSKDFKGKYYGPDVFKGNQAKIDAWKKAGKPRNADGSAKG